MGGTESKWLYKTGDWKKVIKQVHDDIQTYPMHHACKHIIFVVIDSAKDIPDPALCQREFSGGQMINGRRIEISLFIREP
jgi:hypothetical protein